MDAPAATSRFSQFRASPHFAAIVLALLAVALRLPGISRPLLGNFATRQVLHGMIARHWARGEAGFFSPTLDCLVGDRPALHLTELPLMAHVVAALGRWFGGNLDVWARGVSIAFSALAVGLLYDLARRRVSPTAASAAAFLLAIAPVSVVYGQGFLLEPSAVAFGMLALWSADRWRDERRAPWLLLMAAALSAALLTKIYLAIWLAPLACLAFDRRDIYPVALAGHPEEPPTRLRIWVALCLAVALALVPVALWLWHVATVSDPSGGEAARLYYSLRDSLSDHRWPSPLWSSPSFYAGVARDLATVTLTPIGALLAIAGLQKSPPRWLWIWLAVTALLILAMPRKFHEMNYYFVVVAPPCCLLAGLGWEWWTQHGPRLARRPAATWLLAALALAMSARYSLRPAFATPAEDRHVLAAAAELRALSQPGDRIVAIHGSTIDLLYYCDRPGWALAESDPRFETRLDDCRAAGGRWLVAVDTPEALARLRDLPRLSLEVDRPGYLVFAFLRREERERRRFGGSSADDSWGN